MLAENNQRRGMGRRKGTVKRGDGTSVDVDDQITLSQAEDVVNEVEAATDKESEEGDKNKDQVSNGQIKRGN